MRNFEVANQAHISRHQNRAQSIRSPQQDPVHCPSVFRFATTALPQSHMRTFAHEHSFSEINSFHVMTSQKRNPAVRLPKANQALALLNG
jgi:hypothetical protein